MKLCWTCMPQYIILYGHCWVQLNFPNTTCSFVLPASSTVKANASISINISCIFHRIAFVHMTETWCPCFFVQYSQWFCGLPFATANICHRIANKFLLPWKKQHTISVFICSADLADSRSLKDNINNHQQTAEPLLKENIHRKWIAIRTSKNWIVPYGWQRYLEMIDQSII